MCACVRARICVFVCVSTYANILFLAMPEVRLLFCSCVVAKYREFHQRYNDQAFKEAGQLLFSLLDSRLAPLE